MNDHIDRRDFLKTSAVVASTVAMTSYAAAAQATALKSAKPQLKTAVKIGMVRGKGLTLLQKFQLVKEVGFDGIEMNGPSNLSEKEVLEARDKSGLPIHGVVDSVHWKQTLSDPDPEVRAQGLAGLKKALRNAKTYGATSTLLVPATVTKEVSYADAYKRSQAEIKKAIPLAEELGIKILIENVWNNFLLSPLEEARYIDELESPMVGAYFDVGNVVRYGWPAHWIRTLGKRVVKLDIKEYSRKIQMNEGTRKGFGVKIGEGDCEWPDVMQALSDIGYNGWATAEVSGGGKERLTEILTNMNKAFGNS